jgi:hypothetical protein
VDKLEGMTCQLYHSFIIFYQVSEPDTTPFPRNTHIRILQAEKHNREDAWRGDIVIAKARNEIDVFSALVDITTADIALIHNYFRRSGVNYPL